MEPYHVSVSNAAGGGVWAGALLAFLYPGSPHSEAQSGQSGVREGGGGGRAGGRVATQHLLCQLVLHQPMPDNNSHTLAPSQNPVGPSGIKSG